MNKKIHMLLVIRWPVGGIRTFLRYVYRRFDKRHYKLTIILPYSSELESTRENLKDIDVEFRVLPERPGHGQFVLEIIRCLLKEKIDLVHSHGFTSGIYAALPARLLNKTHILTSHDVINQIQFEGVAGKIKKNVLRLTFYLADVVHSVSHDAQKNLFQFFPELKNRKSKTAVIPNGIEVSRFLTNEKIDWRNELNLSDDVFLIGFFGRFMAQKGFKYLVDAMEKMRDDSSAKSKVLAFGWGGFIREEQREIKRRGLTDSFIFLPFQENIAKAIRGVDVVAMPSIWEAYGLLAAEVMVAGVPLIGTNCVGLREVLDGTPAYVINSGNKDELVDAILSEIKSRTKSKAATFRYQAAGRFSSKSQIDKLKTLINNVIQP